MNPLSRLLPFFGTLRFFLVPALAVGLVSCPVASAAQGEWSLRYGKGVGQVGFDNASTTPVFEEPAPLGPLSFRMHGTSLWVADSVGGRILAFAADGRQIHAIAVPGAASNTLLEDFALVPGANGDVESLWVADGADLIVRKLAVADGKELSRLGGPCPASGAETLEQPGKFRQIHQIEVGPSGRVYVGDYGRAVIAVFDASGTLLREFPWLRTGFVVLPGEKLCFPVWNPNAGWSLKTWDESGILVESLSLSGAVGQNPRLWSRTEDGAVLTCIPSGGYRGFLHLLRLGAHGQLLARSLVKPTQAMNRFLDLAAPDQIFRVLADYDAAPGGAFRVVQLPSEGDRTGTLLDGEGRAAVDSAPFSAIKVDREAVAEIPEVAREQVLGLRSFRDQAVIALRDGRLFRVSLETGAIGQESFGRPLIGFALVGPAVVGIGADGALAGPVPETWAKSGFSACRIDVSAEEGLLSGGIRARYLPAAPATQAVDLDEPPLAVPFRDGLLWAMRRPESSRVWHAEFMDMFGNRMKRIYRFAPEFDPAGLTLEPLSIEGELLLSFWTGKQRELALIGQNGRMFWRLPAPDPVCQNDLAWDHRGRLLILERNGAGLRLSRLIFAQPEG